jgi:hypothetical protein
MGVYREVGLEDAIRECGKALQPAIGLFRGTTLVEVLANQGPEQRLGMMAAFQKMTSGEEISPTMGSRGTQDLIEPILLAAALERGSDVRFSTELVSFEQDETGVTAVLHDRIRGAAVLKGNACPVLLDTYTVERQPVGRAAAEASGARSDERGLLSFERLTTSLVGNYAQILGGYGYKYVSQAIIAEEDADPQNIDLNGQPGTRVLHLWVEYQGERVSTVDLAVRDFVLLAGPDGKAWCAAARRVAERTGVELKAYRVAPDGDVCDAEALWSSRAGIQRDGALLVRPDGFVAWRVGSLSAAPEQEVEKVLASVSGRVSS